MVPLDFRTWRSNPPRWLGEIEASQRIWYSDRVIAVIVSCQGCINGADQNISKYIWVVYCLKILQYFTRGRKCHGRISQNLETLGPKVLTLQEFHPTRVGQLQACTSGASRCAYEVRARGGMLMRWRCKETFKELGKKCKSAKNSCALHKVLRSESDLSSLRCDCLIQICEHLWTLDNTCSLHSCIQAAKL